MIDMERYMSSRFFIDFKTLPEQISVITKYVASHFLPCSTVNELFERYPIHQVLQNLQNQSSQSKEIVPTDYISARLCLQFFDHLFFIIQRSCVCLSIDERDHLLRRISELKYCYHLEYEYLFANDEDHRRIHHAGNPPLIHPLNYSERYVSSNRNLLFDFHQQLFDHFSIQRPKGLVDFVHHPIDTIIKQREILRPIQIVRTPILLRTPIIRADSNDNRRKQMEHFYLIFF